MGTYVPPLPPQNFIPTKTVVTSAWLNAIDSILQGRVPAAGTYLPTFLSGEVQLTGPGGYVTSYGDLGFSLLSPGPAGSPGPFLRVAGAGKVFGQIGTDAQIPGQDGISLYIAAGDTDPSGTSNGGTLWDFAGGSFGGRGGDRKVQAGTSVHGPGGDVYLLGGNNKSGDASAGNIYLLAGTNGNAGGSIKIYATNLNNVAGDISFWLGQPDIPHSVPLWTMSHTGALFPGNQGAGNPGDVLVSAGNLASPSWGPAGLKGLLNVSISGAMTVASGQIKYITNGRSVTLWSDVGLTGAASGPNDLILSPIPTFLIPAADRYVPCCNLVNGNIPFYTGVAHVDTVGGVTMSLIGPGIAQHNVVTLGAFSNVGVKGITAGWTITYPL